MHNKLIVGIITLSMVSLFGCGSTKAVADNTNTVTDNTNTVADNTESNSSNQVGDSQEKEPEAIKIEKNKTVSMTDGTKEIDFTLTDVVFEKEVHSTSDNMYQQYFPDIDDESYICAKITVKNTGGDTVDYNFFDDITVTFDNKYNYGMQQLDLASMVMSQYWSCQPLKSYDIYFLQSVPDDVKNMGCNITFKVGDTLYKY